MKSITATIFAILISFTLVLKVNAQAAETIWITTNATGFKTGETVIVDVNSISATPIQGFNFQIRYDPACLQPNNASSPISGMNGLGLPQTSGLVDASFASTTPQTANGILAEVHFTTLGGCQTDLTLENATLVIRNDSGFAAPLTSVTFGASKINLSIDQTVVSPQAVQPLSGTPLSLAPNPALQNQSTLPMGTIGVMAILGVILVIGIIILFLQLRKSN